MMIDDDGLYMLSNKKTKQVHKLSFTGSKPAASSQISILRVKSLEGDEEYLRLYILINNKIWLTSILPHINKGIKISNL